MDRANCDSAEIIQNSMSWNCAMSFLRSRIRTTSCTPPMSLSLNGSSAAVDRAGAESPVGVHDTDDDVVGVEAARGDVAPDERGTRH